MKLYVHYDAKPPFTSIFHLDSPAATVGLLAADFAAAYNRSMPSRQLKSSALVVKNAKGKVLDPEKRLQKALKDKDDVFVETVQPVQASVEKPSGSQVKAEREDEVKESGTISTVQRSLVQSLIAQGEEMEKQGRMRAAVAHYQQVFTIAADDKSALLHLLKLWMRVGRPAVAEEWCRAAYKHHCGDVAVLKAIGDIRHACGKHGEALGLFNKAIELLQKGRNQDIDIKDVKLGAARAMYKMGGDYEHLAAKLVMEVVEPDNSHVDGLLEYSIISYDRGQFADAAQVLLRVITKMEDNEVAKTYLARALETEEGMHAVISELKSGARVGSAYAFLAGKVKDKGAIKASLKLYDKALEADPQNPSFALNYAHTLEITQDYKGVLQFARKFCEECHEQLGRDLELREIVRSLRSIGELYVDDVVTCYGKEAWSPEMTLKAKLEDDVEDVVQKIDFSRSQLDLLALVFTIIKVLFVTGALSHLAKLMDSVELARKASKKELHTTLIRNEAAYFGCISQILLENPPPSIVPGQDWKPLYLCGDSHCLSGAWRHVTLRGEERVLMPQLITGCKIWHLRDEGDFYPKRNFESAIQKLPKGAQVIMMFGEIDCREGIMLAVEKCKYDSEADAISTTVNIYIKLLRSLIQEHKFEIFVHPISPVLDITRPVVTSFMRQLKKMVLEAITKYSLEGKLHWLDFFDQLLTDDGVGLNPEIIFDGTHMNPKYIDFLKESLGSIA